jgi:hypothetical protein
MRYLLAAAGLLFAQALGAQTPAPHRLVDGLVMHGEPKGPRPISGVRVVLHRVGPDRAGPLDSMLTDARGRYHFNYTASGSPDALYFISASFDGIAYFSAPLRDEIVRGDDAQITVFDTTSAPVPIHVLGHHIILGIPDARGRREAVEVFELGNDTSVTRVSAGRDRPVWSAPLPAGAVEAKINPTGDVAPSAVTFTDGHVRLFAPVSPGARQLSYAYQLPKDALPLSIPIDQPTSVLEVLLEEPKARLSGPAISEVAPTTTAGRTFRRFLGQNIGQSVLRVDVPFTLGDMRNRFFLSVAIVFVCAMIGAIGIALRSHRSSSTAVSVMRPADELLHAIAVLDARFEQTNGAGDRAAYDAERSALKSRLVAALAEEGQGR